jgi:serine/threonine protein kinase
MNTKVQRIHAFDGTTVWLDHPRGIALYDIGNYLGGGVAGTVYQCDDRENNHYALKILNPLGYKLLPAGLLRRCVVLVKGTTFSESPDEVIHLENVWWLVHAATKQYIAAYFTQKHGLKELNLSQCVDVWGTEVQNIDTALPIESVNLSSDPIASVPTWPHKFGEFLKRRSRVFREINNMYKIPPHVNVITLYKVLELYQESKSTLFLVMELANGGELFDQIRIDQGTDEGTARQYFMQVIEGLQHCHVNSVCHRDLKPENLLLVDTLSGSVLKIADFGFSSRIVEESEDAADSYLETHLSSSSLDGMSFTPDRLLSSMGSASPLRVLKSVVGSPFYVAPEVLHSGGYDGSKADIWSLGIILYAMLAGNLPFDQDIGACKRFKGFRKWINELPTNGVKAWDILSLEYPPWLFPAKFSKAVKGLLIGLLHPDPNERLSVHEAKQNVWCSCMGSLDKDEVHIEEVEEAMEASEDWHEEEFFRMEEDRTPDRLPSLEPEQRNSDECFVETTPVRKFYVAPPMMSNVLTKYDMADLLANVNDEEDKATGHRAAFLGYFGHPHEDNSTSDATILGMSNPPNFNDGVRRSTRFVTYVSAVEVLELTERILEGCRQKRIQTSIGHIGKVEVFHDSFRVEIWSLDLSVPPLCAIQLYQMPPSLQNLNTPQTEIEDRPMYLVEFIRGQVEIFPFKRFYQWLRQQLAEVIKSKRMATPELSENDVSLM